MSPHPYGSIPTTRSEFLALLRERQREFARLNALASAATLLSDFITALELHLDTSDNITVDLAGAIAHSHASPRSLRRWVKEGVVRKVGERYVVATLPVLTRPARAHATRAARPRTKGTAAPMPPTAESRVRTTAGFSASDAAEQFRAGTRTVTRPARRHKRKTEGK